MIKKVSRFEEPLYQYYSKTCKKKTHFVVLNKTEFQEKLIKDRLAFISKENGEINGFLSACLNEKKAYITITLGEIEIIKSLIGRLERELIEKNMHEIWIHFFNPVQLPWYPMEGVTHPGVQGVEYDTPLYQLYRELGYLDHSLQETYYQTMNDYKEHFLFYPSKELGIDLYDPDIHHGLKDFAKGLKAKHWEDMLINNDEMENPLPLLVALDDGAVIGFAGPLKVQDDGRGYFAGIGILETYRGRKLGKYLFNNLCRTLKNMGAEYMTFFTGQNNVAKHIYLSAGFIVVKRFMTMKKTI